MENASKALIMAGGVLIGILVITFMVVVLRAGGNLSSEYDSQLSENELLKFNSKFEGFQKNDNTIFDVVTVVNLAYDINKQVNWNTNAGVTVYLKTDKTYRISAGEAIDKNFMYYGGTNKKDINDLLSEYNYNTSAKTFYKFKCQSSGIKYNTSTGKVNEMTFEKNW